MMESRGGHWLTADCCAGGPVENHGSILKRGLKRPRIGWHFGVGTPGRTIVMVWMRMMDLLKGAHTPCGGPLVRGGSIPSEPIGVM